MAKIKLDVTEKTLENMENMKKAAGVELVEVFEEAFTLLKVAMQDRQAGRQIGSQDPDGNFDRYVSKFLDKAANSEIKL